MTQEEYKELVKERRKIYEEKLDFISSCIRLFILLPIYVGLFFLNDFLLLNGCEILGMALALIFMIFAPYIFFKEEVVNYLAELTIRKLHL